jgi:C-terminal processing protease CtpA/Prc
MLGVDFSVDRKTNIDDLVLQEFIQIYQVEPRFDSAQTVAFEVYFDQAMQQSVDNIISYFEDEELIKANDSETLFWGKLENNIGYLHIVSMELAEIGSIENSIQQNKMVLNLTLDQILEDFSGLDGVIIDIRLNGGGDDFVSHMIASRFYQTSTHVYSKQARLGDTRTVLQKIVIEPQGIQQFIRPVAVLTSSSTSSAAEVFAMVMRERANTVLVGEATGGGLSDILPKSLPNGTEYSLSNEYYLTPAGELFEGIGVPVDIEQNFFSLEQRELAVDLGIEKALHWIQSR